MSKLSKLIKDPDLFFYDLFKKRIEKRNRNLILEDLNGVIPAFHIADWKRNLISDFFGNGKKISFLPFKNISRDLIEKIIANENVELLVWGMNLPPELEGVKNKKIFIEDGFIRSVGLGSDHTLPFSLNVDSRSLYFDSRRETDLELMIKNFNPQQEPELIERAKLNIEKIIKYGISKYNNSQNVDISKIYGEKNRKRILVVGQVEDDASIIYGSEKRFNNNDLVVTARLENPEAEIIYKPHPDVLFGKRKELSNPKDVENICKIVTGSIPISQMLETVDHVYTITSQVGFEALLRGIKVTTLGAPFYSGWGLTDDRQIVERRNVKRTILDLFAVCYIKYPMYINPYTKKRIEIEDAINCIIAMK
ncbi:hypothetical protein [uncultured Alistipes sp.]|uniref:capsular polysaccharide export protein, LipB/KpsS family n=1 Tax=uncultured Alistipes sp. TaxID=538949 RepID=UPI002592F005|nr:hypothetical protein [uncultured Alistipes sp.]